MLLITQSPLRHLTGYDLDREGALAEEKDY
jgi:hypothetical protein